MNKKPSEIPYLKELIAAIDDIPSNFADKYQKVDLAQKTNSEHFLAGALNRVLSKDLNIRVRNDLSYMSTRFDAYTIADIVQNLTNHTVIKAIDVSKNSEGKSQAQENQLKLMDKTSFQRIEKQHIQEVVLRTLKLSHALKAHNLIEVKESIEEKKANQSRTLNFYQVGGIISSEEEEYIKHHINTLLPIENYLSEYKERIASKQDYEGLSEEFYNLLGKNFGNSLSR